LTCVRSLHELLEESVGFIWDASKVHFLDFASSTMNPSAAHEKQLAFELDPAGAIKSFGQVSQVPRLPRYSFTPQLLYLQVDVNTIVPV
jgi:hypothetical protein